MTAQIVRIDKAPGSVIYLRMLQDWAIASKIEDMFVPCKNLKRALIFCQRAIYVQEKVVHLSLLCVQHCLRTIREILSEIFKTDMLQSTFVVAVVVALKVIILKRAMLLLNNDPFMHIKILTR